MVLQAKNIWQKLENLESSCQAALQNQPQLVPTLPGRDVPVFLPGDLPGKKGLSFAEGQARLLHDLASIELQAMELGLRGLIDFPEAPEQFREELYHLTLSEGRHLKLCLEALESLGYSWGHWPVHLGLWQATAATDSLLDRVLIVHRYLEGSGLDAGETFLRKLESISQGVIHSTVRTIVSEEIDHVEFGSRWYHQFCRQEKLDPEMDFVQRLESLRFRVPKRIEKISRNFRQRAGFTEFELNYLERLRESIVGGAGR